MAVENFLEKMNALVKELKSHPKVTLINYFVPPPATEKDVEEVEAHIGMTLPEDIKAFYRQCNGIQLRWVHKDNKEVDQKLWSGFIEGPFDYEEIGIEQGLEGVVNILGIREVFFRNLPFEKEPLKERQLGRRYTINGEEFTIGTLQNSLWNFDLLTVTFDPAVLILPKQSSTTVTLMGSNHRMPMYGAPCLSLRDYLELILIKKGVADAIVLNLAHEENDPNSNTLDQVPLASIPKLVSEYDLNYPYHRL